MEAVFGNDLLCQRILEGLPFASLWAFRRASRGCYAAAAAFARRHLKHIDTSEAFPARYPIQVRPRGIRCHHGVGVTE